MIFVFAYILSWGWMTYVFQDTRTPVSNNVSLTGGTVWVVSDGFERGKNER